MSEVPKYLGIFVVAMAVAYLGGKFRYSWQSSEDENEMQIIQKYLLNESPLYGHNKPKLWIHTTYEVNARQWKSFYSRNTTDLNQPYIHLTVKTIINHCSDDFHICLIDDQSFGKLIPYWNIDISTLPEPLRSNARELGMAQILYMYGGMIVPNSFLCMRPLKSFYENGISNKTPFVVENVNHVEMGMERQRLKFIPHNYFMGCRKHDRTMYEYVSMLQKQCKFGHFTEDSKFQGSTTKFFIHHIDEGEMRLIDGGLVGVKTIDNKAVLLEDLMEDNYLNFRTDTVGIYIPAQAILNRPKYQWFASLRGEDILQSNMIISKYLASSMVDTNARTVNRVDGNYIPEQNRLSEDKQDETSYTLVSPFGYI